MEYLDFALGLISGIVLVIISQIVGHYFSKRNLEAQHEHTLRVAKMQLYHEERKKAIVKLDELLKVGYKSFSDFRNSLNAFLDGSLGIFLPERLRRNLKDEIESIDQFLFEKQIEIQGPPPDLESYFDDRQAWFESLDPYERVDVEVRNRLSRLKSSMRDIIKQHISEE